VVIPLGFKAGECVQKLKRIREVLIKLRGNVILLRDEKDPDSFFPRFNLWKTSSFVQYDSSKHEVLKQLHDNYFYHSHHDLWTQSAKKTLPVLMSATQMLMCGEDLGFVPSCVPPIMGELGIIGLRIQRMPGPEAPSGVLHSIVLVAGSAFTTTLVECLTDTLLRDPESDSCTAQVLQAAQSTSLTLALL
jgi:hypothetical protein